MFWYDHDLSAWGWIGMTIGMIAFWVLVIGLVVWAVRGLRSDRGPATARPTPEQVLAERFARGEIDQPEYYDRLAALRDGRAKAVR